MKTRSVALALLLPLVLIAGPSAAEEDEPAWGGKPLSHWIEQLKQGPTGLGQAPEALIAIGAPAVPALRRTLMAMHPAARQNAAQVLGLLGAVAESTVGDLAELLADESPSVRAAGALALGRVARALDAESESIETVERLVAAASRLKEALDDPDATVRTAVLQGMALMGGFSQDDMRALLVDHKKRGSTFEAIRALGPEASELAVNLLKHPSWHVRKWTVRHMISAKLDERSWLPALADATHDESEAVAYEALRHLAYRIRQSDDAAKLTVRAFSSPHPFVKTWAPIALAQAKRVGPAGTRALIKALGAEDPISREGAAWALGQSTAEKPAVIVGLTRALEDKELRVRWSAARSLVELGETPEAALAPLREALLASRVPAPYRVLHKDGHDIGLGRKRHSGLTRPQPEKAWPSLLAFGKRGSAHLAANLPKAPERWTAIHALGRFDKHAVPHLKALLGHREEETRRRAALTLSTLPDDTHACLRCLLAALEARSGSDVDEVIEEPVIEDEAEIDWHETALYAIKKLGLDAVPKALELLAGAHPKDQQRLQPGLKDWLVEVGKPAVPHLEALRADFELGAWIDGVVTAIEDKAEADAAKKAKDK